MRRLGPALGTSRSSGAGEREKTVLRCSVLSFSGAGRCSPSPDAVSSSTQICTIDRWLLLSNLRYGICSGSNTGQSLLTKHEYVFTLSVLVERPLTSAGSTTGILRFQNKFAGLYGYTAYRHMFWCRGHGTARPFSMDGPGPLSRPFRCSVNCGS